MKRDYRQIYAQYNEKTIRVYQAYRNSIADKAVTAQTFVPPFKLERMTWIKPSFLWMMYRSNWAQSEGQENILAIDISREGFEWALKNACLSHYDQTIYQNEQLWEERKSNSRVRIQWDPERDIHLQKLEHRSIQIGLSGDSVKLYVEKWIQKITNIKDQVIEIRELLKRGEAEKARALLPEENWYPVEKSIASHIGESSMLT